MKEELKKIEDIITKPMTDLGIIVSNVDFVTENNYRFLKIILDKESGLDLDAIVEATKIINPLIDEYDLVSGEYILDISSKERG